MIHYINMCFPMVLGAPLWKGHSTPKVVTSLNVPLLQLVSPSGLTVPWPISLTRLSDFSSVWYFGKTYSSTWIVFLSSYGVLVTFTYQFHCKVSSVHHPSTSLDHKYPRIGFVGFPAPKSTPWHMSVIQYILMACYHPATNCLQPDVSRVTSSSLPPSSSHHIKALYPLTSPLIIKSPVVYSVDIAPPLIGPKDSWRQVSFNTMPRASNTA